MVKSTVDKEKKKRIITLSIIFSCVALVLAGIIVGLVFLLKTDDPKDPGNLELDKFAESLNNNNQSTPEIVEQEVVLPENIEVGNIVYVDNKYIVAEDANSVQSVYVRNESEGNPTKINVFYDGETRVTYNKVFSIYDDFSIVIQNKNTYVVDLVNNTIVKNITAYDYFQIKNNYLLLINYDENSNYSDFIIFDLNNGVNVLTGNQDEKIEEVVFDEICIQIKKLDGTLDLYKYETKDNKLVKFNLGIDLENSKQRLIIQVDEYFLIENLIKTDDPTVANYNDDTNYYVVEYYVYNLNSNKINKVDFGAKVKSNYGNILDNYYGLELEKFKIYNTEGKIYSYHNSNDFLIVDKNLNVIFTYNKGSYGDIIYFDGDNFLTSGTTSNFLDKQGNRVEVLDKQKYWINSLNVWNGLFIVEGVSGYGISDTKGNVIASNDFDIISPIIDGYAIGFYNGHYYKLDLNNKIGKLINNYSTEYAALTFMGCGFYVTEQDGLAIYDMNDNIIFSNVSKIDILEVMNDRIKLFVYGDKTSCLTVKILNYDLALQFKNGSYNPLDIDENLESYEQLSTLNISNLKTYCKQEENIEDIKSVTESEESEVSEKFATQDQAYQLFTLDLTDFKGSSYDHEDELLKNIVEKKKYLDYCKTFEDFKKLLPDITDWNTASDTFGKINPASIFTDSDDSEYFDNKDSIEFKGSTVYGGTYAKCVDAWDLGSGLIVNTLIEHIVIEKGKPVKQGGCDNEYTVTTSTIKKYYSLYYGVYFQNGITINEFSIVSNGNKIMDLYEPKYSATDNYYGQDSLIDCLVTDSDSTSGVLVNNGVEGSWGNPKLFEGYKKEGNVIKMGSISLPNGTPLYGMSFSLENDFKVQRECRRANSVAQQFIPIGGDSEFVYWSYSRVGNKHYGEKWCLYETLTNIDDSRKSDDGPSSTNWTRSSGTNATMGIKISYGLTPASAQYTSFKSIAVDSSNKLISGKNAVIGNEDESDDNLALDYYSISLVGNNITITSTPGYYISDVSFDILDASATIVLSHKKLYISDSTYTYTINNLSNNKLYFVSNLCVKIKPIINSITYYKKIDNYDKYGYSSGTLDKAYKLYYGAPLINDMQKILTFTAGSYTSNGYVNSIFGINNNAYKLLLSYSYDDLFGIGHYYEYIKEKNNVYYDIEYDNKNIEFSYMNSNDEVYYVGDPGDGGSGAYAFFNYMFSQSSGKGYNYDAYMYVKPKEYEAKLILNKYYDDGNKNTILVNANDNNVWKDVLYEKDFSLTSIDNQKYKVITFNQFYKETLEHALKRWCGETNSGAYSSDFKTEVNEGTKFPVFKTPTQYTNGTMVAKHDGSTYTFEVSTSYTTASNYSITMAWEDRKFDIEFDLNADDYDIDGANKVGASNNDTNNVAPTEIKDAVLTEGKNTQTIPLIYGYKGTSTAFTSVLEFKGWYLNDGAEADSDNLVYSASTLLNDNEVEVDIQNSKGYWLDPDFDDVITLYAHYESVEDTKFTYTLTYPDDSKYGAEVTVSGADYNRDTGIITCAQNTSFTINIDVKKEYCLSNIDSTLYNCLNRGSDSLSHYVYDIGINYNSYTDTINTTDNYSETKYSYAGRTISGNQDKKITLAYDPSENTYSITVATTIGAISTAYYYYGGTIVISLGDKQFKGDVGVGTVTSESGYSATSSIDNPITLTVISDIKNKTEYFIEKSYFNKFNIAM